MGSHNLGESKDCQMGYTKNKASLDLIEYDEQREHLYHTEVRDSQRKKHQRVDRSLSKFHSLYIRYRRKVTSHYPLFHKMTILPNYRNCFTFLAHLSRRLTR